MNIKYLAIALGAMIISAGPASAVVYSVTIPGNYEYTSSPEYDVYLPKYSGPGKVSSVTLSISGYAGGVLFEDSMSGPVSWTVDLYGPYPGGEPVNTLTATVHDQLIYSPPPPNDPFDYQSSAPNAYFSADQTVTDIGDFTGAGQNYFAFVNESSFDNTYTAATITELLQVPEPASWALMLAGSAVLGAALRRRASAACGARASELPAGSAARRAATVEPRQAIAPAPWRRSEVA